MLSVPGSMPSGRNVQRAGQIIHHGIEQRLHALLLEGGTAQDGNQFDFAGQAADGGLEHLRRNRLVFDDQFGHFVVLVGNGVINSRSAAFGLFLQFRRECP
jgi:hypothetical protein